MQRNNDPDPYMTIATLIKTLSAHGSTIADHFEADMADSRGHDILNWIGGEHQKLNALSLYAMGWQACLDHIAHTQRTRF